jgi:hypothetical protein
VLCSALLSSSAALATRTASIVGHCRIEGPAEMAPLVNDLARRAGPALQAVSEQLGVAAAEEFTLFLMPAGGIEDKGLARLDARAPRWAGGYLIPSWRLGAIRLGLVDRYPYQGSLSVLVHEATHMMLHDTAGGALPRWFDEGVATWVDRQWQWRDGLVLSSALLGREVPPLASLDRAFSASEAGARLAYAASFDFVAWSVDRFGVEILAELVRRSRIEGFEGAWRSATGESLAVSEESWRRRRLWLSRWLPIVTASSTLWAAITGLALLAIWRRRKLTRDQLARWEAEEAWALADMTRTDE